MLTFQDQYKLYQKISQDFTADGLLDAKRDINEGGAMFLNRLGRKFNKEYLQTSLVGNQQYYQMSSSTLRISEIQVKQGDAYYTPQLVTSEEEWNDINSISSKSNLPTHYYIRGFNEIGLYPTPSSGVTNGLKVSYEPQHVDLTQDDFITGTITVNNNQTTITHSATGFTPQMVGRWMQVTDGSDGKWYRIGSYLSSSQLVLENFYEGVSGSGRNFRIGEIMKIPNAYQDAPVFFALNRFYDTVNDEKGALKYERRFELRVKSAKETYGRSTSRMGVKSRRGGRRPSWIDLTPPVQYP